MRSESKSKLELPSELRKPLANAPVASSVFEKLPPSHRRQYAVYIGEAKQAGTRERRARKAVEMLRMIRPA